MIKRFGDVQLNVNHINNKTLLFKEGDLTELLVRPDKGPFVDSIVYGAVIKNDNNQASYEAKVRELMGLI